MHVAWDGFIGHEVWVCMWGSYYDLIVSTEGEWEKVHENVVHTHKCAYLKRQMQKLSHMLSASHRPDAQLRILKNEWAKMRRKFRCMESTVRYKT